MSLVSLLSRSLSLSDFKQSLIISSIYIYFGTKGQNIYYLLIVINYKNYINFSDFYCPVSHALIVSDSLIFYGTGTFVILSQRLIALLLFGNIINCITFAI